MSKKVDALKENYKKAVELFKDKNQEEANKYITENLYERQFTKVLMTAYINKYAITEEDKKWVKKDLKKASYKEKPVQKVTVLYDDNGNVLYKSNKKGKAIPVKKRVNSGTGEVKEVFSIHHAREEFAKHFGIEFKSTGYEVKEEGTKDTFDPFMDLFN